MRHGVSASDYSRQHYSIDNDNCKDLPLLVPGTELGCYFCNDVVAPGNVSYTYFVIYFFPTIVLYIGDNI